MKEVYKLVKNNVNEALSIDKKKELSRYFCGYLLKADPPDYEYIRVERITAFLEGKLLCDGGKDRYLNREISSLL